MKGQLQLEQEKTLKEKLHTMAESLRNFKGKQCKGKLYNPRNNSMCAYGALGFMSGIPKNELGNDFTGVLKKYGIDLGESIIVVNFPNESHGGYSNYPDRQVSLFQAIFLMNDRGFTFNEIANYLDKWANEL